MARLYRDCDVVCLASLFEGLPVSVLEAMAAGKPVVASRIPGIDEAVVDGVTGILVEPRNAEALSSAIRGLLHDPSLAARIGARARERAESHFSARAMADGYSRVYERTLAERA
jgi:glycosyltransferase involved in cell wall biosynthesis